MSHGAGVAVSGRTADHTVAFAMGLLTFAVLYATAPSIGYARDEGFYFQAAESYGRWLEVLFADPSAAITQKVIDAHFAINAEHPSLMKLLFSIAEQTLHQRWRWISDPGLAYRVPGMLMAALAVTVTVGWASNLLSRPAGILAGLLLLFMPRWFHHSHLACFDVAIASLILLCTACYRRAIARKDLLSALCLGLVYGLALATKHNAWWLPAVFLLHLVMTEGRFLLSADKAERWLSLRPVVWMCLLGPLVLVLLWPWLWHDTFERLRFWVEFHLHHEYYNMEFLGRTYHRPPMPQGYAWLMTLGTVPGTTLLLSLLGGAVSAWHAVKSQRSFERTGKVVVFAKIDAEDAALGGPSARPRSSLAPAVWDERRSTDLLLLLSILSAYAPWWLDTTPIFGGTKHWLSAYPFFCLFAARGYGFWCAKMRDLFGAGGKGHRRRMHWIQGIGALSFVAPAAVMTWDSVPFGLSAYTPLVGGAPGAATLGLNRTFWGYTSLTLADSMHELAPQGARVYVHDTAPQSWAMHQQDGTIERDLVPTLNIAQSTLALYHHEPHMERVEYQIWEAYGTTQPAAVACYDGVPIVWLYQRP